MAEINQYKWDGELHKVPARDNQKQKVYDAERRAFNGNGEVIGDGSMAAVEEFVRRVEASQTWRDLLAMSGLSPVSNGLVLKDGRRTRWARGGRHSLNLPRWARTYPVVLHEMAHSATGGAALHSWPFCAAFLVLVGRFLGAAARDKLKAEFKAGKVRFTPPRKLSPERLAKLKAQGYRLAAAKVGPAPEPTQLTEAAVRHGTVLFIVSRPKANEPFVVKRIVADRPVKPSSYRPGERLVCSKGSSYIFNTDRMFLTEPQALAQAANWNRAEAAKLIAAAELQESVVKAAQQS